MRRRNKTNYLLAFSALLLAATAASGWFAYGKISEVSKVTKEAESQIAFLEAEEREFSNTALEIDKSRDKIAKIDAVFLREETFVNFVELLESIARTANVKIETESAKLPREKDPAFINFRIEGDFSQIMRFFVLLDRLPVAGLAKSVEIAPPEVKFGLKPPPGILAAKVNYIIFNFKAN